MTADGENRAMPPAAPSGAIMDGASAAAAAPPPAPADATPRPAGRAKRDLTTGPIASTLLLFAMPTLLSNILQSLNGSINSIWVGRFLGEGALAATSNANLVMFLMFSALFGFSMSATIIVGQSMGRQDPVSARRAMGTAIGGFLAISVVIAGVGWLTTPALLRLLATPPDVQPLAIAYLRVIFLMLPAAFLTVLIQMGLRGCGDALTPFWFMALSVVLDSGLNPVFILGLGPAPRLGIAGAATATLIATYASLAAMIATIYARDLPIRLRGGEWAYLRPDAVLLRTILGKGAPMGLQMVLMSVAGLALIGLVNRQGTETTAAYGVTSQLWAYIQMPALALGAAVSAMVAQNIGAGRWDRIDRVTRAGVFSNLAITGTMVVAVTLADRAALGLFLGANSPAVEIAAHIHHVAGWSFPLMGIPMILFATVRANGAVYGPLAILTIAFLPVRLGVAYLLLPHLGADALWWSIPASVFASLLMAVVYYRRGGWRWGGIGKVLDRAEAKDHAMATGEPCGKMQPAR